MDDLKPLRDASIAILIDTILDLTRSDTTELESLKIQLFKVTKTYMIFPATRDTLRDGWNQGIRHRNSQFHFAQSVGRRVYTDELYYML